MTLKENPPTQRDMANKLNTSVQTINKTIRVDLGLKKVKKTPSASSNSQTHCRKKDKFQITL